MACLLQIIGFLMVAFAENEWMAILGVVLTSLSSGLGEASFLSYSSEFHKYASTNENVFSKKLMLL